MWKALLAAALLCLAAGSYGQPSSGAGPPNKEAPHANADQEKQPALQPGPASVPEAYKSYPDKYAEACYQAQNHDTADLCAQWRSAVAAERAADATSWGNYIGGAGAILSFASIILVLIALGQTRRANQIASNTGRHQLRAYISLPKPDLDLHLDAHGDLVDAALEIEWRNVGQTPATRIRDRTAWQLLPGELPDDFEFRLGVEPGDACDCLYLGPTQHFKSVAAERLTAVEFHQIAAGRFRAYVWAAIDYLDVFEDERRSEVAFEMLVRPLENGEHSIGFNALSRHNGVDEGCMRPPQKRKKPRHWLARLVPA